MRRQTFHGATVYVSNVVDARLQHAQYHAADGHRQRSRSEEHTSELQSHSDLVCRLLLEKKLRVQGRSGLHRLLLYLCAERALILADFLHVYEGPVLHHRLAAKIGEQPSCAHVSAAGTLV